MKLAGQVAVVTGAGRGIGRAIAGALGREGAAVVLAARSGSELQTVAREIEQAGGRALAVPTDVRQEASVEALVRRALAEWRQVDVLVNAAGVATFAPVTDSKLDDWDQMLAVNLRGPFACCQEVLPDMLKHGWGRIINISSVGGQWGGMNQVHYACAKAGLNNLTRSLAKLYSAHGVLTNTVAPGLVATRMVADELETAAGKEKVANIPAGRIATTDEVAHVVAFLASDDSGYITGQTINVNGGMYFGT